MNISQLLIAHTGIISMSLENLIPSACTTPDLCHKLLVHPPICLSSLAPVQSNPARPPPNNVRLSSPQGRRKVTKEELCLSRTFWGICSTIRGQPWLGRPHVLVTKPLPKRLACNKATEHQLILWCFLILSWISSCTCRSSISFLLHMYDSDENTARHVAIQVYIGHTVDFKNVS